MSSTVSITVNEENTGIRIDKVLSECMDGFTRSGLSKLIESGNVCVNSLAVSKNYKCRLNDSITVNVPDAAPLEAVAENIPLDIVYEDGDLLVVNKAKGMVVHPAAGNYNGTLVNALLYHCKDSLSGINGVIRPGIVHRIDKDTSGLLIVAKNDMAHISLAEQIKEHSFHRAYQAVCIGNIKDDRGTINLPIGRHPIERKKMAVTYENSKNAVTHYEVIKRYGDYTHIRCILETGRTHQIRVHMAYMRHPLAGDLVYSRVKSGVGVKLNGQCLHASEIGFVHPRTNEYMEFKSELPQYFKSFLNKLEIR